MQRDRSVYFLSGGLLLLMLFLALLRPAQSSSFDVGFHLRAQSGTPTIDRSVHRKNDAEGLVARYDVASATSRPRSGCLDAATIAGARVLAFGAYEGGAVTNLAFAGEGDEVRRIHLQADNEGPPLVLIFSAYDPIVWDFAAVPSQRVRGILVYGYGPQAVANLAESVPVRFVSRDQGVTPCGQARFAYKGTSELGALRAQVREVLGVPIAGFIGSYNPEAIHLDGGNFKPIGDKPINASQIRSSSPVQVGGLSPGDQGLRQLVARGDLRPATATDLARWESRGSPRLKIYLEETYVVVRQTTLPRGMEGMNRRFFLIPKGVPLPFNRGVHNGFYHLENGSCSGFC